MQKSNKKFLEDLFVLILVVIGLILGSYTFVSISSFLLTKKETLGYVIGVRKEAGPKPFNVKVKYYNSYTGDYHTTEINDIDSRYAASVGLAKWGGSRHPVVYKKYFPQALYLKDYKHPTIGYLILLLIFNSAMILGITVNPALNRIRKIISEKVGFFK
jgi:hypothetical protein